MRGMRAASVDAIVTDPPYGLGFMGKGWDHSVPGPEYWRAALRVAKPGAHLVAFGGPRLYHRLACAIEDAGWEIRDSLTWLFGEGMPKGADISKAIDRELGATREVVGHKTSMGYADGGTAHLTNRAGVSNIGFDGFAGGAIPITKPATPEAAKWEGWNTTLKPGHEPIVLARAPLFGSVARNVRTYGTGGINVDGCRVPVVGAPKSKFPEGVVSKTEKVFGSGEGMHGDRPRGGDRSPDGRWPANVLLDEDAARELDAQTGELRTNPGTVRRHNAGMGYGGGGGSERVILGDRGGPSRFFYCAKATTKERRGSTHPTIKPVSLMRWLCRLVTPPGGIILDMFAGTGTTGEAARLEGFDFVLIERDAQSVADARRRLDTRRRGA